MEAFTEVVYVLFLSSGGRRCETTRVKPFDIHAAAEKVNPVERSVPGTGKEEAYE